MRIGLSMASILLLVLVLGLGGASPLWAGVGVCDDDGDTIPCEVDNCLNVPNGAPGQPAGALVAQCDWDRDGYGNACDPDLTNDGIIGGPDYGAITFCWGVALPCDLYPGTGCCVNDVNCDGVVGGPDFGPITANFGGAPGPSGLPCAGTIPCP